MAILKNAKFSNIDPERQKSIKKILNVIEEEQLPINPKLLTVIKKISNLN